MAFIMYRLMWTVVWDVSLVFYYHRCCLGLLSIWLPLHVLFVTYKRWLRKNFHHTKLNGVLRSLGFFNRPSNIKTGFLFYSSFLIRGTIRFDSFRFICSVAWNLEILRYESGIKQCSFSQMTDWTVQASKKSASVRKESECEKEDNDLIASDWKKERKKNPFKCKICHKY